MNNNALELAALASFKEGFEAMGCSKVIAMGADKMPRAVWAKATAFACSKLAKASFNGDTFAATAAVLSTVVGNSSQLGMRLFKEQYLTEAGADQTADAILENLRSKL